VHIYATTGESMARAKEIIGGMTRESRSGKPYQDASSRRRSSGRLLKFSQAKTALVHISELADFRVNRTEDVVKLAT